MSAQEAWGVLARIGPIVGNKGSCRNRGIRAIENTGLFHQLIAFARGDRSLGLFKHLCQWHAVGFFVRSLRLFLGHGAGRQQKDLLDRRIGPLRHEPCGLIAAARMPHQIERGNALRFQPVDPGRYLIKRVGMLVGVGRGAVIHAGAFVEAKAQGDGKAAQPAFGECCLHGADDLHAIMGEGAVGDENGRRPKASALQRAPHCR